VLEYSSIFTGSCVQVMVTIGVLFAILVGVADSWRWLTIACLATVVLWALLLLAVPETPAHHLANRRYREARQSLEWLRGTVHVDAEYEDIQRSLEDSQTGTGSGGGLSDLLKRQNLVPLIISLYLMLGQQLSGMNAVIFYVVDIFQVCTRLIQLCRNRFVLIWYPEGYTIFYLTVAYLNVLVHTTAGRNIH
jgi:hypothetical protein